jgi:hypothetical protein
MKFKNDRVTIVKNGWVSIAGDEISKMTDKNPKNYWVIEAKMVESL